MSDLNAAGWHLHFITKDRKIGGHVLGLDLNKATVTWDYTNNFKLHLPDGDFYKTLDFSVNQDDDIKEVEQGQ
jgi:acetolactate decarboxylase